MRRLAFKFFTLFLGLGSSIFLSSCTLHRLDVQTQYLSHENLASYYVGTPDPHLDCPTIGQRLCVQWSLSAEEVEREEVFLYLKVRLRHRQEQEIKVAIHKKRGFYLYELVDQEYCQSGGILTYYAEIRQGTCVLASWKHPLWATLITFDFSQEKPVKEQE